MPRIQLLEQTIDAPTSLGPTPQAQGQRFISGVGEGMQSLARGVDSLAQGIDTGMRADLAEQRLLQHQEEENGKAYAATAVSQAQVDMATHIQNLQQSAAPGAPGFAGKVLSDFDDYAKKTIEQAPTPAAKKFITEHMQALRPQYFNHAMTFEAQQGVAYRNDAFSKAIDNVSQVVAANPTEDNLQTQLRMLEQTNPSGTPDERQARMNAAEKSLRTAAWASLVQRDPAGAKAMIDKAFGIGEQQAPASQPPGAPSTPIFRPPAVSQGVLKFSGWTQQQGAQYGVDPSFLMAQQQVESSGNPNALNRTDGGSVGIAQFQPGTAKRYGIDPTDPQQAINGQARYMADLLKMFGGDYDKAAAGYNWGEGNVQKAVDKYGDNWKDHIPASTRDYLNKINALTGSSQTAAPSMAAANVPPDARIPSSSGLVQMTPIPELLHWQNQAEQEVNRGVQNAQTALRVETQNAEAQAQAGVMPTGPSRTIADFQAAFPKDPAAAQLEFERYDTARKTAAAVVDMQRLPTQQLAQIVQTEPPPGSDAVTIRNASIQQQAAAQIVKRRLEDPWGAAIQNREVSVQPTDLTNGTFGIEIMKRAAARPVIAQKYGVDPLMLSKSEANIAGAQLKAFPVDQKAQVIGDIARTLGNTDRAAFHTLMTQIAPDSPVTQMAAGMMLYPTQTGVAQTILKGEAMLNQSPSDKKQDGKPTPLPIPTDDKLKKAMINYTGQAFVGQGQMASQRFEETFQAVRAYYAARAFETGKINPDKAADPNGDLLEEAVDAVTGGAYQWNGHATFVPWGMSKDQFGAQLEPRIQSVLNAHGYGQTDWKNYDMVELDNGRYLLAIGGNTIKGAIVDFNKPLGAR